MTQRAGNPPGTVARTVVYYVAWALVSLAFFPLIVLAWMPAGVVWAVLRVYIGVQIRLLRWVCGIDYQISGWENVPEGPVILASRHESLWETLVLPYHFGNPVTFLKEEITRWPVVGLLVRRLRHVAVRRDWSPDRMREDFARVKHEVAAGRSMLIFPSGTRNPEKRHEVQTGVAVLYRSLGIPCVPIVLDSAKCWPHRSWLRRAGTIQVRILPAIEPGLPSREFVARLGEAMRGNCPADPGPAGGPGRHFARFAKNDRTS